MPKVNEWSSADSLSGKGGTLITNNNHWATLSLCHITLTDSWLQPCYHEIADRTASRTDRQTDRQLQSESHYAIEHYLKACAGKPDCTEMKMYWVISMLEQSGFCTDFTLVSIHIVTISTDDHSLVDHLVWLSTYIHVVCTLAPRKCK